MGKMLSFMCDLEKQHPNTIAHCKHLTAGSLFSAGSLDAELWSREGGGERGWAAQWGMDAQCSLPSDNREEISPNSFPFLHF